MKWVRTCDYTPEAMNHAVQDAWADGLELVQVLFPYEPNPKWVYMFFQPITSDANRVAIENTRTE
jgi:hypothetical protein